MFFILSHLSFFVMAFGLLVFAACSFAEQRPGNAYPNVKRIAEIMFAFGLVGVLFGK